MHFSDYFTGEFSPQELYFKKLHDSRPAVYNDPLYSLFGHIFAWASLSTSDYINEIPEQSNRVFTKPLPESSFENLNAAQKCSVVFSGHMRYVPSRFHAHEYFELIYQHSGRSYHNINGTEICTKAGDLIVLPPLTYHSVVSPFDDSLAVNIGVKLSDFSRRYGDFLRRECSLSAFFKACLDGKKLWDYLLLQTTPPSAIDDTILNALMVQETAAKTDKLSDTAIPAYLQAAATQLFSLLFTFYGDSFVAFPRTNKNTATLVGIMYHMKINYRDIDLGALAKQFHFTEPYLSRLIKSGTGHTFSELLSRVRLNTSLLLLGNTRLPVADIANMVGYKAPENYMRNFKLIYGVTPTMYRKTKSHLKRTSSP